MGEFPGGPFQTGGRALAAPTARAGAVLLALCAALAMLTGPVAPAQAAGDVGAAQRRLNLLGCDSGGVDGSIGPHTQAALWRFQSRHRLPTTGVLDAGTSDRLFSAGARRCDVRPVPVRSGTGRRVVISQAQNWIWLVRSDGTVAAQGGMVDNPSVLRKGSYHTGSYCGRPPRQRRTYSGQVWLYNFVRFAPCGVGMHRIPVDMRTGAQIMPNYLLGTDYAVSHGCIRLSRAMSLKAWDFTARGRTSIRVK